MLKPKMLGSGTKSCFIGASYTLLEMLIYDTGCNIERLTKIK